MPFNLPILLTWLRIVAIPLLIAVYYLPASWATAHERDLAATLILWPRHLPTGQMAIWPAN
jgi:cardiolipin synthase